MESRLEREQCRVFSFTLPAVFACTCDRANGYAGRHVCKGDFLFRFCINTSLHVPWIPLVVEYIYEMVDVFTLFLIYKTLLQGRLASYTDTTKGALWSNSGLQIKVRKI